MNKMQFEFIVDVPVDEETIRESHKVIAQALINKYGANNMRKVLKIMEAK